MKKMKKHLIKISLVLVAVVGVVFALRSQPSASTPPFNTSDTYGNGGRYRLIVATDSYGPHEYVIDTQSGRVWHSAVDTQKQRIVFVSYVYQNIDGDLSTVPNETATSVVSRSQPASASQPSSSGTSQPFNFFDEATKH